MASKAPYRTTPADSTRMPAGIPYIIGNEAAERFSFYGMRAVLVVFMTTHLMGRDGALDLMSNEDATAWYHVFTSAVYFFPLAGALLADAVFGKYRTIIALSFVYCLGHLALAVDETRWGLSIGLSLIAVGAGGIKPCVSANVGDQFGHKNETLLERVYAWFYFAINLGAFTSTLLTPYLLANHGPGWAFGVPGALMALATFAFWRGRYKFAHIPPGGMAFVKEVISRDGLRAVARLFVIYLFVAMFWSLFDQTGSSWVIQAKQLNRNFLGIEWLPSQIQALNPLLVMILIPLTTYGLYPAISRVFPLTPLRKISIGLFITVPAFLIIAYLESQIAKGFSPSIGWQALAFVVMTTAEVFISITCLEFSYTQAPNKMKSLVMSIFLLSVSIGNAFTAAVNFFIQNPDGSSKLEGASYFMFFAAMMLVTAIAFIFVAARHKVQSHIQESDAES
jgi:POT family proton-dependent oligopeptide transporter